jgi:hypothetical protein
MTFALSILFWAALAFGCVFAVWLSGVARDLRHDPTLRAMDQRDE